MTKFLRNAVLCLSLTSCLAIGMDKDEDGTAAATDTETRPRTVAAVPSATTPIAVSRVGLGWKLLGFGDEFVDPVSGQKKPATVDSFSAALGAACGITQTTQAELRKREVELARERTRVSARDKEISELREFLAATNATKEAEGRANQERFQALAACLETAESQLRDSIETNNRNLQALSVANATKEEQARTSEERLRDLAARLAKAEQERDDARRMQPLLDHLQREVSRLGDTLSDVQTRYGEVKQLCQFATDHLVTLLNDSDSTSNVLAAQVYQGQVGVMRNKAEAELAKRAAELESARHAHEALVANPQSLPELVTATAAKIEQLTSMVKMQTEMVGDLRRINDSLNRTLQDLWYVNRVKKDLTSKFGKEPVEQFDSLLTLANNWRVRHKEGIEPDQPNPLMEMVVNRMGGQGNVREFLRTGAGLSGGLINWVLSPRFEETVAEYMRVRSTQSFDLIRGLWAKVESTLPTT